MELSVLVFDASEEHEKSMVSTALASIGREVEVRRATSAPGRTPGAAKNDAVRAALGRFVVLCGEADLTTSTFPRHAVMTLERDPTLSFVTSWFDGVPITCDRPSRAIGLVELLSRPWFLHVPTLFRRELWDELNGFDESLLALDDLDFWLRALGKGKHGHAIEAPDLFGPPLAGSLGRDDARSETERLFQRHSAVFQDVWAEVVLGKERLTRELMTLASDSERKKLELEDECRRLRTLLGSVARAE
jgi:hypothetical protein